MWKHKNFINLQLHAPQVGWCTINFDSHIKKIIATSPQWTTSYTWTTSGETQPTEGKLYVNYNQLVTFEVTLDTGYVLDTVTLTEGGGETVDSQTDTSFVIKNGAGVLGSPITLTSKQKTVKNYIISSSELTAIADATKVKADITTKLTPVQIAEKINNLTIVADIDTADKMATLLVAENEGNVYKYVGTTTTDYINGDLYVVEAAPSSEETWVLNETLNSYNVTQNVNFKSKNTDYTVLNRIYYKDPDLGKVIDDYLQYNDTTVYSTIGGSGWVDNAYRTITLAEPATDETLLTWLQSNGTKQGEGVVTPVGYKLTLTNLYLNAGNTVTIHMNNVDGTSTAANTLSTGMSWDNVVSFYITDTYGGNTIVTINGVSVAMPTEASPYTLTQDTTFTFDNTCLTADMLVTLADGSEKQICELTPDDTYITYDFATGDLATAPAEYIDAVNGHSGKFASQYQKYTFEDGTVIKEVHKHRFLNLRKMEFINLCHWEIGDRIYKIDGTTPALVSKETIVGEIEHFTVTTSKYHNGFVQGCLYGDRYTQKYEIKMVDGKPVYDFSKPHTVDYLYGKVPYSD